MNKTNNTSTGHRSTGHRSTGDYSTGYRSTGHYSTGYHSTGYQSAGHRSTGDCSTGNYSTGDYSTGNCSTGDRSTGGRSTGSWSISKYSTGHFSTIDYSGFGAFNKPCTVEEWSKAIMPNFLYFNLTEWISEGDMTEEEKELNPTYKTTGSYLKAYKYEEAFQRAFDKASKEEIEQLKNLPNFDADVFKEISGIDITKHDKKSIILEGKEIFISSELFEELKRGLVNDIASVVESINNRTRRRNNTTKD
jgi:hypothetical protein